MRLTGSAKNTVTKLLVDAGEACSTYMNETLVDLPCERIECDEIWSFVYSKAKNVPEDRRGEFGVGDVWTWVALDSERGALVGFRTSPEGPIVRTGMSISPYPIANPARSRHPMLAARRFAQENPQAGQANLAAEGPPPTKPSTAARTSFAADAAE